MREQIFVGLLFVQSELITRINMGILMQEKESTQQKGHIANIGYGAGWIFGVIPLIGIAYSLIYIFKGFRRKAFQAITVSVINLISVLTFFVISAINQIPESTHNLVLGVIWVGFPLFLTYFLTRLEWPKQSLKESVEKKKKVKLPFIELGWRIYFWIIASIYMFVFAIAFFNTLSSYHYYINLPISLIGIIGLYGYAYRTAIATSNIWKFSAILVVIWGLIFFTLEFNANNYENIYLFVTSICLFIPQYFALYFYGFGSNELWQEDGTLFINRKLILLPIIFVFGLYVSKEINQPKTILRPSPERFLSEDDVKAMIIEKGFYEYRYNLTGSGFNNDFEVRQNGLVILDHSSGLMWQQSGSEYLTYDEAENYIKQINKYRFAGFEDWRLPTLEELLSLIENSNKYSRLKIDPVFDTQKEFFWTSDKKDFSNVWAVDFLFGRSDLSDLDKRAPEPLNSVRAVRTFGIVSPQSQGLDAKKNTEDNLDHDQIISTTKELDAKKDSHHPGISFYKQLIEENPDVAEPYFNLGQIYSTIEYYDSALICFDKGIRIKPNDAKAHYSRGNIFFIQESYDLALNDFTKAITLDSKMVDAYFNRAKTYGMLGEKQAEIDDYSQMIKLRPDDNEVYLNRGAAYKEIERNDLAIKDFTSALLINPNYIEAYYFRGLTYGLTKNFALAQKDLEQFIELAKLDSKHQNKIPEIQELLRKLKEQ